VECHSSLCGGDRATLIWTLDIVLDMNLCKKIGSWLHSRKIKKMTKFYTGVKQQTSVKKKTATIIKRKTAKSRVQQETGR
jgi:hypothetical protein